MKLTKLVIVLSVLTTTIGSLPDPSAARDDGTASKVLPIKPPGTLGKPTAAGPKPGKSIRDGRRAYQKPKIEYLPDCPNGMVEHSKTSKVYTCIGPKLAAGGNGVSPQAAQAVACSPSLWEPVPQVTTATLRDGVTYVFWRCWRKTANLELSQ